MAAGAAPAVPNASASPLSSNIVLPNVIDPSAFADSSWANEFKDSSMNDQDSGVFF